MDQTTNKKLDDFASVAFYLLLALEVIVTSILSLLRAFHVIHWNYWWVLAPLWLPLVLLYLGAAIHGMVAGRNR